MTKVKCLHLETLQCKLGLIPLLKDGTSTRGSEAGVAHKKAPCC